MKRRISCIFFITIFLITDFYSQEISDEETLENMHQIVLIFGLSHIPEAFEEGELEEQVFLPAIGFDYYYRLNEKWKLVFGMDIELAKYQVDFQGEEIKREGALIIGIGAVYEILQGWSAGFGPGLEFERNKNLFVLRIFTDYAFELGNDLALAPYFSYDFKQEYDTYNIGVGLHKRF